MRLYKYCRSAIWNFLVMKFLVLVLFLSGVFVSSKTLEVEPETVLDFLKFNNLQTGICFYCTQLPRNWFESIKQDLVYLSYHKTSSAKLRRFDRNKIFSFNQPRVGVIFDSTCNETADLLKKFSSAKLFNASYSWLMFAESYEISTNMLRSQNINLDSEITLAIAGTKHSFDLYDVYNPNSRTNGKLIVNPIGQWTQGNGYNVTLKGTKFQRRFNLNGATFHAAIIAHLGNESLIPYIEREDKLFDVPHRYHYKLFKVLQERHNFR